MKKSIKKIALVLAMVLILGMMPFQVMAEPGGENQDSGKEPGVETTKPEENDENEKPEEEKVPEVLLEINGGDGEYAIQNGLKDIILKGILELPKDYEAKDVTYTWSVDGDEEIKPNANTIDEDIHITAKTARTITVTLKAEGKMVKTGADVEKDIEFTKEVSKKIEVKEKIDAQIVGDDIIKVGERAAYEVKGGNLNEMAFTWEIDSDTFAKIVKANPTTLEGVKVGTVTIKAIAEMTGGEDIVLTKKVKVVENIHKVTLVADEKETVIEVAHGDKISDKHDPKKDGYVFKGWYTDKEFKNKYENKGVDKDITLYAKFEKAEKLEGLIRQLYIKGYPDGTFRPQGNLTRAEATMMFGRLINGNDKFYTSKTTKFVDANNSWYSEVINFVVNKGLIKGYEDGTFKPNKPITRAEFAQMISGYLEGSSKGDSGLKDIENHWAKDAIEKVYGKKVVKGYPDGTFKPNQEITRAEAVTILNAAFGRVTNAKSFTGKVKLEEVNTFKDISTSDWFFYDVIDAATGHTANKDDKDAVDIWTALMVNKD
ncbi:MAG: S-layer homology domain-containing protein [Tissierellia bacterium]|nr:S-layer homology domain-containing protein [Tissierellia bacterium]